MERERVSASPQRELILHVIDSLDISGGAERQLAANLRSFDRELFHHVVAVVKQTAESRAEEIRPYAPIHFLHQDGKPPTRMSTSIRLYRLVRELRPDLLHASLPLSGLATRIVARRGRVRAVESLVNISHERVRLIDNSHVTPAKLWLHTVLDRVSMRSLLGYHAVSQAVADSWAEIVGLDTPKIKVIPRGIDPNAVRIPEIDQVSARQSVRAEFSLPDSALIALSVGRVEPQKGHRYLVEALARIADEVPRLFVLIVGRPGNASPAVEREIASSRMGDRVILTGSRQDLPRLLAAADMFVFPSLFEGNGGNAMIEAMMAGLAVVTSNAAPMTDLVPDESVGLLVDRLDSKGLGEAMKKLAGDARLRASLGAAAQGRATQLPTAGEVAQIHEEWYRDLLGH